MALKKQLLKKSTYRIIDGRLTKGEESVSQCWWVLTGSGGTRWMEPSSGSLSCLHLSTVEKKLVNTVESGLKRSKI